jgi:hypothetical protein
LREGDANTKNFHLHARHRKRKNFIAKLTTEDHIYTKHEDKAALVDLFFDNLLATSTDRETSINLSELGIPTSNLSDLDMPFCQRSFNLVVGGCRRHSSGQGFDPRLGVKKISLTNSTQSTW